MTTHNPYAADPHKGAAFEMGYVWGFTNPAADDNPPPYAPDLLEVYLEGVDAGKDDWGRPPDGPAATSWTHWSELQEQDDHEWLHHLFVEGVAEGLAHLFRRAAFGLAGVVITVLGIPGDTPLRPLDDDFEELYTGPEADSNVVYVATCAREDHPIPAIGTTPEGYWAGSAYNDFGAALKEAVAHEHSEALVARCSLTDNTCGLVWAAR
ncbi:hypothetical protein SAMN04244553_6515 [Nocardia amikacinitolerans]|uniref:Uncharacterized protein n=1 Tax=Nocardia amikacinitolerans TaxID=756689 RepID=A0A285LZB6_9NOCA|nr:hypothetical protein [Nocardia amikacinitolerans]MCP2298605.1 hypothetical protein [Nocardia amikacinitolerans]SNY89497.1 hypothetical protein SAMN04244553_6515 [Nocardia amikacinitolerans]